MMLNVAYLHLDPKIDLIKETTNFTAQVIIMDYPGQIRNGYTPVLGCNFVYHSHPQSTTPIIIPISSSSIPTKPTSLTTSSTQSTTKPNSLNTSLTHSSIHFPISFFSHSFPNSCIATFRYLIFQTYFFQFLSHTFLLIPYAQATFALHNHPQWSPCNHPPIPSPLPDLLVTFPIPLSVWYS